MDPDTGNNAAVTMTAAKLPVTVDGGLQARSALGTLANQTTTVDLSAYKGEVTFTAEQQILEHRNSKFFCCLITLLCPPKTTQQLLR